MFYRPGTGGLTSSGGRRAPRRRGPRGRGPSTPAPRAPEARNGACPAPVLPAALPPTLARSVLAASVLDAGSGELRTQRVPVASEQTVRAAAFAQPTLGRGEVGGGGTFERHTQDLPPSLRASRLQGARLQPDVRTTRRRLDAAISDPPRWLAGLRSRSQRCVVPRVARTDARVHRRCAGWCRLHGRADRRAARAARSGCSALCLGRPDRGATRRRPPHSLDSR
jgi:hypothetical protein